MKEYQIYLTFDSEIKVFKVIKHFHVTPQEIKSEIAQNIASNLGDDLNIEPSSPLRYIRVKQVEKVEN